MKLPPPYPDTVKAKSACLVQAQSDGTAQYILQEPKKLLRDTLWSSDIAGELEFVVDNQSVASLANIESRVSNEFYRPVIERVREGLRVAYSGAFRYKAGHLSPADWRPREFNSPPDVVCNWVLAKNAI